MWLSMSFIFDVDVSLSMSCTFDVDISLSMSSTFDADVSLSLINTKGPGHVMCTLQDTRVCNVCTAGYQGL